MLSSLLLLFIWGEGSSLAFVDHPSSDGIIMKILYEVDVLLYRPASQPSSPIGLMNLNLILLLDQLRLNQGDERWW